MKYDSIGTRQKQYELDRRLVRRIPVIGRLDGKAFHTLTRYMDRPYDKKFQQCMWFTAHSLCEQIQGCQVAYTQSDEITLLITDYKKLNSSAWFDYRVEKMCSTAAGYATNAFRTKFEELFPERCDVFRDGKGAWPTFDARFNNVPREDVTNNFLWRQQDCTKNSISMLAQAHFSHKELECKNSIQKQDMLVMAKNINWNDMPTSFKRGVCIIKETYSGPSDAVRTRWVVDEEIPIFSQDRKYIDKYVFI